MIEIYFYDLYNLKFPRHCKDKKKVLKWEVVFEVSCFIF